MATAFSTIIRACAKEAAEGEWPVVATTTANGDADSLVDTTNLKDSSSHADSDHYVGKWVRLTISTTENIRRIKTYTPSTGTLVPEASFSGAPGSSNTYEIHYGYHPTKLKDAINDALNELTYEELLPLSLVTDGDMTGSDATAYWKENNCDTAAYDTSRVLFGTQSVKAIDNGSGGGYLSIETAGSGVYPAVTPGEQLIVAAAVYGDQQGAKLTLYDVTNSTDIETARHDEEGWALLAFTKTVPDDCYEVDVHLETVTASGTTYWNFVSVLKGNQRFYDRPSWLTKSQDFIRLMSFPAGPQLNSDNADNAYRMWTQPSEHVHCIQLIEAHRGVVPLRLELDSGPARPIFVAGKRNYPSLSADTDETEAHQNTVVAGALHHLYQKLGEDYAGLARYWGDKYASRAWRVQRRPEVRMVSPYAQNR